MCTPGFRLCCASEGLTSLPVTSLPFTSLPVTSLPVTILPFTSLPVTSLPVTSLPVTSLPVTSLPVYQLLVYFLPVTSLPVTSLPVTSFQLPVTSLPFTSLPVTSLPVTSLPAYQLPVYTFTSTESIRKTSGIHSDVDWPSVDLGRRRSAGHLFATTFNWESWYASLVLPIPYCSAKHVVVSAEFPKINATQEAPLPDPAATQINFE
ncbi:hepatitis A virus cellular receptor 1-like [Penaeus japonicus]|uniref:hepatitis A virus cellular receptor 1-like n=1 Tax=Penaeus japonicus TaxID=27405 RepID=UPI001C71664F|nr:hepatitis A virus cellular receptor 1-like [Penaeus japonicus]